MRVVASVLFAIGLLLPAEPALGQGARRDEGEKVEEKPAPVLTKPPVLLQAVAPEYPDQAVKLKLEAQVKVRIHINEAGEVTRVDVPVPVGNGFDEAAVAAAEQYIFEPAEFDGVPGPIVVETVIHFQLAQEEVVPPPPPPPKNAGELAPEAQGPPSHGGDYRQPITIEGQAVERGSRSKLAGVIVSVAELGIDAITDESGRFYFHGIPPGTYHVLAVDDKYDPFKRELVVAADEKLDIRLWLRAKGGNPYETVVEGERERLEVTKRTIQRRQMTTVPGTFGDPVRVIQTLPGLARTPFVTGFLLIRGSNPDDSGVFIDGHRVPLLFHFLGGPSILNAEFLESIDLYPGGFPTRFGRAHGGIVAIETRSAKSDGVHGSADVDLLDAGGYVRFPVGDNGALALAGRRSYLDFMLDFFLPEPDPGETLIVVPVYYDYQARYDLDLKEEGELSITLLGSSDELDVVQSDAEDDTSLDLGTTIRFNRLIGTYKRPIAGDLTLTLSGAYGRDSLSFGGSQLDAAGDFTSFDVTADVTSYRMRVHGDLTDKLFLDTGLDLESRVTRFDLLVPLDDDIRRPEGGQIDIDPEALKISIDGLSWGMYADLAVKPTDHLKLVPGIRFDAYLLNGEPRYSFDPRISGRYRIDDHWTGKGYVGLFHQPPQPEALDDRFGNPDLELERGIHVGAGAEYEPTERWLIDGEVYFIDRSNQAAFTFDTVTDPDTGEVRNLNFVNSRRGDTIGAELLVKRKVTRNIFGWLSYTLSKTRTRREPGDDYNPTGFDQRHTLNAVASYKTDGGWEFGGRFRLATGRPETPIVGGTYDADDNDYEPLEGETFSARAKTFHQLDVRAEKTWVFKTWMFGIYVDIQNALNIENVEATQYDYRFRESAPITGVPFVPTIGIRGQW
jgi:TonB family protein